MVGRGHGARRRTQPVEIEGGPDLAMLRPLVATADIGDLAREAGWPEPAMATLYHQVGAAFDFDRLRAAARCLSALCAEAVDLLACRS